MSEMGSTQGGELAAVELPNACGDCFHPIVWPDTDGEPCEWCRDCGCDAAAHDRIERLYSPTRSKPTTPTHPSDTDESETR